MGRNKLPLRLGGVPLIQRVYGALRPHCGEMLVVGAEDVPLPPQVRRIPDRRTGQLGPLAGMETALLTARHRTVFVAAGDMPFLSEGLVSGLLDLLSERQAPAVVPRYEGRVYPLCAAYDRNGVLPAMGKALDQGMLAVRDTLESLPGVVYVEGIALRAFGEPEQILANVNSPEDLRRVREALGESSGGA